VQELLGTSRLLTLTGAGGCGKTRLALEVAAQPLQEAGGGIWLVELAPLSDPERVPQAIATVLEAGEERFDRAAVSDGGRAPGAEAEPLLTQTLVEHLKPRRLLLLLDNCEHLLSPCAQLVERLLRHCPQVRILATSREGLGLPGEQIYRVPSLLLPDASHLPPLEQLQEYEAVRLFTDRAALSQPGFAVTPANAPSVVQICRQLDGMPLAIELAAARLRVMEVEQLAARLDDRFRLLTGGSRTALPRQQTLQATLDWSYDLLSEAERALLRGLSVFAGGFTLEAAEAVCAPGATHAVSLRQTCNVLDQLLGLVEKSLVGYEPQRGDARYRLLETVREYAREKLDGSGELTATRNRHRDWYLQLAEREGATANLPEERDSLLRLERERDNFRAALRACHEAADRGSDRAAAEAGLRLASALGRFWICRGYLAEGLDALETALADGSDLPAAVRAPALQAAAQVAGTLNAARAGLLRQQSRHAHETVLQVARDEGSRQEIGTTLLSLVETCFWLGDLDATWTYGLEARQLMEELGDLVGLARTLEVIAGLPLRRGDPRTARSLLEERLAICRKLGKATLLVHALGGMGHLERDEGNHARARSLYAESLVLRRELDDRFALAQSLEDLAALAGREQQTARAVRLLGAGEAFCETLGARPPVAMAAEYERTVAEGRATLGEAAFAAAWTVGRALSLEEAIACALEGTAAHPIPLTSDRCRTPSS
jgi:predicted ATPase